MSNNKKETISIYCPKCGVKINGSINEDGALKICCRRCKASLYSRKRNEREIYFRIVGVPSLSY